MLTLLQVLDLIFLGIIFVILIIFIKIILSNKQSVNNVLANEKKNDYAILIPARYESKVIANLLDSIKNQTYKIAFQDVYIIVESEEDETVTIAKKYGASIFLRTDLTKQRKGYALDECLKMILEKEKKYDAFFIFDADNTLSKDFIQKMNYCFNSGYDVASGYRSVNNWDVNRISVCSGLTFTMLNQIGNRMRVNKKQGITVFGTGFYISYDIIKKLGGYPFHSLTEDYELSLYLTQNKVKSIYYEDAIFYDEQPTSYKQSKKQRLRWCKGYFEARKKFKKDRFQKSLSILPIVALVVYVVLYVFLMFILAAFNVSDLRFAFIFRLIATLFFLYMALLLFTLYLLNIEKSKMKFKSCLKAIFYNPFFLAEYAIIAVKALCVKDVKWDRIDHNGS